MLASHRHDNKKTDHRLLLAAARNDSAQTSDPQVKSKLACKHSSSHFKQKRPDFPGKLARWTTALLAVDSFPRRRYSLGRDAVGKTTFALWREVMRFNCESAGKICQGPRWAQRSLGHKLMKLIVKIKNGICNGPCPDAIPVSQPPD